MTKGARCSNYGECEIADTGKRVNANVCPECRHPTVGSKKGANFKGGKPGLILFVGIVVVVFMLLVAIHS